MSIPARSAEHEAAFKGMGEVITKLRERRDIEPEEFAVMIESDRPSLERLERGEVDANWGTLRVVAEALRIPLDRLIELAEEGASGEGGAQWRRWSREVEHEGENAVGPLHKYRGRIYAELIRDCLRLQLLVREPGGIAAYRDEQVRDGVVRLGEQVSVSVARIQLDQAESWTGGWFGPLPYFRFEVFDTERTLSAFAVEIEMVLEALETAHPDLLQVPVPVYLIEESGYAAVEAGEARYLRLTLVEIERRAAEEDKPSTGIRFEIAEEATEEELRPLFTFTMEGITAFLAMSVPALSEVALYPQPQVFAEDGGELGDERNRT